MSITRENPAVVTGAPAPPEATGHTLSVSEVARAAGMAPSAVRFYEAHGLVHAVRTAGGQRRFDQSAVCMLMVGRVAQRVGLTVKEIAERYEELPESPGPEDWARFSGVLLAEAEERVEALRRLIGDLSGDARLCEVR